MKSSTKSLLLAICYFVLLTVHTANSLNTFKTQDISNVDPAVREQYAKFLVKSIIPFYLKDALESYPNLTDHLQDESPNINDQRQGSTSKCISDLMWFVREMQSVIANSSYIFDPKAVWALQMVDSWGKIPEGILSGHLNSLGDWDECVGVRSPSVSDEESFRGSYCFTYLLPASAVSTRLDQLKQNTFRKAVSPIDLIHEIGNPVVTGIVPSLSTCFPSSCSYEDIIVLMGILIPQALNGTVPYVIACGTDEEPDLDGGAITMIVLLSILATLMLIGTVLDGILAYKTSLSHLRLKIGVKIIIAFSLLTNISKWANTSSAEGGFGCIHGLRFFSTCWVLLSHSMYILLMQPPSWNLVDINHIYERGWPFYFILNGFFSVDTFFTMSGLLAAYSILKGLERSGGRLNPLFPLKMYLHRFLRLTPTYGLIIGVLANLYGYFGAGLIFDGYADSAKKNCRKFWWHNLLYINNLVYYEAKEDETMCEGESWYIANDMQFFILCPLFIMILYKWKKIGMAILGLASLASILVPGIYTGVYNLAPTMIFWRLSATGEKNLTLYQKPWHRIGPYLVGMWMGYVLFQIGKKPVKLPKFVVIGGWLLSTATALSLLLGIMPYYDPSYTGSAIGAGVYAGLSRFVWGIVICWIIFACVKGYGGWVNAFLSWKAFIPLGRLTFCVYLSSFSVQALLQLTIKQPMLFGMYTMTNMFFSHVIMCFLVGFVFSMAFESPFIALEKLLFGYGGQESKENPKSLGEVPVPNVVQKLNTSVDKATENYAKE